MLNGLDLFSGIGGMSLGLAPWVRPVAYCEIDTYCRAVLLSQIGRGSLPNAPIWDDVRTLRGDDVGSVDIIYGGFPCQDISLAGSGAGLDGERSGLVSEVLRLVRETKPTFVFLENVPAIRTRGAERVVKQLATLGYDCRWGCLSAYDVGAPHRRDRWFLLAYTRSSGLERLGSRTVSPEAEVTLPPSGGRDELLAQPTSAWVSEPNVCRMAHGVSRRLDRIRSLGNSVVPSQAREAFSRLIGIPAS